MQEKTFREKWLEVVEKKNSVLCAGLDPAEFEMGRGEEGLSKDVNKREWAIRYIRAVAPYCAAIKPNIHFWKKPGDSKEHREDDMKNLAEIAQFAIVLGMVIIEDSKLADIGSTNDAGLYHAQDKGMYAITFSPFAGNMREAAEQAHKRNLGLISMCLMSNPDFAREKNALMPITAEDNYKVSDMIDVNGVSYVKRYIQLAQDANRFGVDGIVVGAPSAKNHIKDEEIGEVRSYVTDNMLVLCPGIGAQGGEATALWKYFGKDKVIANVGRGLMFPNGASSTPEQQAEAAKQYRDMLNNLRTVV